MNTYSISQVESFYKKKSNLVTLILILILFMATSSLNAQISYEFYSVENKAELQKIDRHINSIRIKKDWIINNPAENSQVEVSKWISDSRNTLWQLFAEKRIIIRKETNKEFFSIEEFAELSSTKQQALIDKGTAIIEQ
ncbi:MAG: hypothetical protein COA33_009670 [Fluviicola sp.]|nr:hypothetical protein [Fluviicola sp.]